jgi:hypothetical protein
MIATAAWMIVLMALGQTAPHVGLHELVAHPDRYRDRTVEVRAAFWVTGEESAHLCSDRLDPDDQTGCEAVMPDRAPGLSQEQWDRLVAAGRLAATGDHRVYLTLRGRFEAAESPRWGAYGGYSRRLLTEEVLRVETYRRTASTHAQGNVRLLGLTGTPSAIKVRLADVLADPSRYHGVVIQVTAETGTFFEHGRYLCAKACDDRDSVDKVVQLFVKDDSSGEEWRRFDAACAAAPHVRATFVGRFEASDLPPALPAPWGGWFRFRLVASRVQNVEVSNRPFKR